MKMRRGAMLGVLWGILLTPIVVLLALASTGSGHGDYIFARLSFPYIMLLNLELPDGIAVLVIVLGVAKFPLYGAAAGLATGNRPWVYVVVTLIVLHIGAVMLCFSGLLPGF